MGLPGPIFILGIASQKYDCRNAGYMKIIIGVYRHIPGTYHTSGIYGYLGMSRREAVCKVLERGEDHTP